MTVSNSIYCYFDGNLSIILSNQHISHLHPFIALITQIFLQSIHFHQKSLILNHQFPT